MKTQNDRHLDNLRAAFERAYGRGFRAGLLSSVIVPDIIRGLAFQLVAAQAEGTDVAAVFAKLESAADLLCGELKV